MRCSASRNALLARMRSALLRSRSRTSRTRVTSSPVQACAWPRMNSNTSGWVPIAGNSAISSPVLASRSCSPGCDSSRSSTTRCSRRRRSVSVAPSARACRPSRLGVPGASHCCCTTSASCSRQAQAMQSLRVRRARRSSSTQQRSTWSLLACRQSLSSSRNACRAWCWVRSLMSLKVQIAPAVRRHGRSVRPGIRRAGCCHRRGRTARVPHAAADR